MVQNVYCCQQLNSVSLSLSHWSDSDYLLWETANAYNTLCKSKWAMLDSEFFPSHSLTISLYYYYRGQYDGLWSSNQIIIAIIGLFDHLPLPLPAPTFSMSESCRHSPLDTSRDTATYSINAFFWNNGLHLLSFAILPFLSARACWFTWV